MDALLSFAAAIVTLRLAGTLLRRGQLAWGAGLLAYAVAAGALAWGAAHGWDRHTFRVYYLAGGLLTAPLLGFGSLLLAGRRGAAQAALLYTGLAVGLALAMPVHGSFGAHVPAAQDHLGILPRAVAIAGNSLGTVAVVAVALLTFRRRPVGNAFLVAGIAVAAGGSAVFGTGSGGASVLVAVGAALLYYGVQPPATLRAALPVPPALRR